MRYSVLKFSQGQGRRKTRRLRQYFLETFTLERRDVPALPTNLEQEMLEWVNRFRADPGGEFNRYFTSTSPVQSPIPGVASAVTGFNVNLNLLKTELAALTPAAPLAWHSALNDAALGHNQKMIAQDRQEHVLPGEQDVGTRITAAGYTNWNTYGENIFAYATSVAYAQAGFIIDWGSGPDGMQTPRGHRDSMISSNFKEVGLSVTPENNSTTQVGPLVVTQDFGNRSTRTRSSVLGVIFTDTNSDNFYNAGEGNTGVSVTITGAAGTFTTSSWASGGYQIDNVPAGSYTLTIAGAGISTSYWSRNITVSTNNVKSDFNLALQPKSTVGFESAAEVQVIEGNSISITLTRSGTITDALDVTITPQDTAGSTETWQNLIQPIANGGLVHFDPNQATATFTITTLTDSIQRADTRLNLVMSFSSNRYISSITTKPLFVVNDDGSVGFDPATDISLAEGGEVIVTVRRIGPTTDPLDLTVSPQDISGSTEIWQNLIQPIAGGGMVRIPAGQSTASFPIKALSDSIFRPTTKFNLKLTSSSSSFPVSTDTRAVIMLDDDQQVGFDTATAATVNAGQQVTINLTRTGNVSLPLDVTITPQDLAGATYTWQTLITPLPGAGTVRFNANQSQASIVITSLLDGVLRSDTTFNLVLSTNAANTQTGTGIRPLTIKPTFGTISFEQTSDVPVNEGANTILNLVRTAPFNVAADVDVTFVDLPGSTETWQNILAPLPNGGRYRFETGESQISVVVQTLQDTTIRPDIKIGLKVVSATPIFTTSPASDNASVTVYNDDGTVSFDTSGDIPLREGGLVTISLVRAGALTLPVEVRVMPSTVAGNETWQKLISALPGSGMVRFNPGQLQASITVSAIQDTVIRADSKVLLTIVSTTPTFTVPGGPRHLLIQNDDGSVGFDPATELVLNEGSEASVTLIRTGAVHDALDIKVSPQDLANPTSVWQSLISPLASSGNVRFEPGQTQAVVKVKAIADTIVRADTRFNLALSTNQVGWSFAPATRSVLVVNDDSTVAFQENSELRLNEGGQTQLTLVRSGNLGRALNIKVSPQDLPGATAPWQSLLSPLAGDGILHFEPGQAVGTLNLLALEDDVVRPDTRFNLLLSTTDTNVQIPTNSRSVLVVNNDQDKPGTFQFAPESVNAFVSEAAGKASLIVVRSGGSAGSVAIPWTYTQTSGPKLVTYKPVDLIFAAGQTSALIEIPLVNDKSALPDQVFSVQLGTPRTAGAVLGSASKASLTILDDDPKPTFTRLAGRRTSQQLAALDAFFSAALNPTTTRSITIWKVTDAGTDGLFGTSDDLAVALRSAAYNAAARKITLTFARASRSATPRNYMVSLNASGLQNVNKAPLAGTIVRTIKI